MVPHDILTLYSAKAVEYLIALAFLALFVPFWRYATGDARPAMQPALQPSRRRAVARGDDLVEWFRFARDVAYHPGHAWARATADGQVAVGLDDFAQRLVGPLQAIELPRVGAAVRQGDPAWSLLANGRIVDMVSPVEGTVTAVNHAVLGSPVVVSDDPYVGGWLFKVKSPRFGANRKGLLSGPLAETWLEQETHRLRMQLSPDLGPVLQDGGLPVNGLAQAIGGERWEEVAREFLLTGPEREP